MILPSGEANPAFIAVWNVAFDSKRAFLSLECVPIIRIFSFVDGWMEPVVDVDQRMLAKEDAWLRHELTISAKLERTSDLL